MTYYIIYFTEKKMFLRLHSPPSRQKQQLFGRAV